MRRPSVLIVDDHEAFRAAARNLLSADFDVLGEAATGDEAIDCAARLHPEVVVLDVRLPDIDGFEVARRLGTSPDPPAVVLVSTLDAADFGPLIRASRVRGFITKSRLTSDTLQELLAQGVEDRQ